MSHSLRVFHLTEFLEGCPSLVNDLENREDEPVISVTGISDRADQVSPGDLFVAVRGSRFDGWVFAEEAVRRGAVAIVGEEPEDRSLTAQLPVKVILVKNSREAAAYLSARFYGAPSSQLFTVGVTGTNGKTSVSWLIAELMAQFGNRVVHIGTLGERFVERGQTGRKSLWVEGSLTTPDAISLQRRLSVARAGGASVASIEVSSHGTVQWRSAFTDWDCGIFTNLTHDHLDFHASFEEYGEAKALFFTRDLVRSGKSFRSAVLNIDDEWGCRIYSRLREVAPGIELVGFSARDCPGADAVVVSRHCTPRGSMLRLRIRGEECDFKTKLVGDYNVANVLAAVTAVVTHGLTPREVSEVLAHVDTVPGRLELVADTPVAVYVDYAHTPDALERAQRSLREIMSGGRLITVFGCGGDRDRAKRSLMGTIAGELSDHAVVTSDNPRRERPEEIINEILPALRAAATRRATSFSMIPDRRAAIREAVALAEPGDVVLVAGKGHEDYQEIEGVRYPFSDFEECRLALRACGYLGS